MTALAFTPAIGVAAAPPKSVDLSAKGSHFHFIERLQAAEKRSIDETVALYDEHLRRHPEDATAAIERCRFLSEALYDGEENPLEQEFGDCLADLERRFPLQPEATLYRIRVSSDGAEVVEALLADPDLDWPPAARAQLHAEAARGFSYTGKNVDDAGEHAREAMRLDPSLDLSVIAARALRDHSKREAAIAILVEHLDDEAQPYELSRKIDELIALEDFADAERVIELMQTRFGGSARPDQMGAVYANVGKLEQARAAYAEASNSGRRQAEIRQKLLAIDIARGDQAAAIASYNALRDLGMQQDPLTLRRLHLAARFPSAPWQARDVPGLLTLFAVILAAGCAPLALLFPLQLVELRRRARTAPPVVALWRWRDAWFACGITLAAQVGAGILLSDPSRPPGTWRTEVTSSMLVVSVVIASGLLLPLAWRRRAAWRGNWSPARMIGAAVLTEIALRVALAMWLWAGGSIQAEDLLVERALGGAGEQVGWPLLWVVVALAAPFYEELVFRGALLGAVQRVWSFWPSNLVQATLFAALHGSVKLFPFYLGMGLALGVLQRRSQGLLAPFLTHVLNNSLALLILLPR